VRGARRKMQAAIGTGDEKDVLGAQADLNKLIGMRGEQVKALKVIDEDLKTYEDFKERGTYPEVEPLEVYPAMAGFQRDFYRMNKRRMTDSGEVKKYFDNYLQMSPAERVKFLKPFSVEGRRIFRYMDTLSKDPERLKSFMNVVAPQMGGIVQNERKAAPMNKTAADKFAALEKNAALNKQANMFTTLVKGLQERVQSDYSKRERDYGASVAPEKYKGLEYTDQFGTDLKKNINKIQDIVNGMGSPKTWYYSLHPDTMYGLDLTPVSDIHDYDYTYPNRVFKSEEEAMEYRKAADERFHRNLLKLIDLKSTKVTKEQGIDEKRRKAAADYLTMLNFAGPSTQHGKAPVS
jgi:hypothetical protein